MTDTRIPAGDTSPLPRWLRHRTLAAIYLAMLVYGSLIPFQFDLRGSSADATAQVGADATDGGHVGPAVENQARAWVRVRDFLWAPLREAPANVDPWSIRNGKLDLFVNALLLVPLGVLLRLDEAAHGRGWPRQMINTLLALIVVAWLLECAQGLVVDRVASFEDVALNVAGGLVGAGCAVPLRNWAQRLVFRMYCRIAYPLHVVGRFFDRQRRKPVLMLLIVLVNVLLIGMWYSADRPLRSDKPAINLLPFLVQFYRSYDKAAYQLGGMLTMYALCAMLLSLQFMHLRARKGFGWVVLLVAMLALGRELLRLSNASYVADITGPVTALIAAGMVITTLYLLAHAVRCSCRRKKQLPVAVDRRRVPHQYE